ncbi:hypothetical protein [Methylobacterium tardum]|uniref:hypothetical protein n=1 Tax=Methylobacterium tardum TaxID=374432 RepID=UPI003621004D
MTLGCFAPLAKTVGPKQKTKKRISASRRLLQLLLGAGERRLAALSVALRLRRARLLQGDLRLLGGVRALAGLGRLLRGACGDSFARCPSVPVSPSPPRLAALPWPLVLAEIDWLTSDWTRFDTLSIRSPQGEAKAGAAPSIRVRQVVRAGRIIGSGTFQRRGRGFPHGPNVSRRVTVQALS